MGMPEYSENEKVTNVEENTVSTVVPETLPIIPIAENKPTKQEEK